MGEQNRHGDNNSRFEQSDNHAAEGYGQLHQEPPSKGENKRVNINQIYLIKWEALHQSIDVFGIGFIPFYGNYKVIEESLYPINFMLLWNMRQWMRQQRKQAVTLNDKKDWRNGLHVQLLQKRMIMQLVRIIVTLVNAMMMLMKFKMGKIFPRVEVEIEDQKDKNTKCLSI